MEKFSETITEDRHIFQISALAMDRKEIIEKFAPESVQLNEARLLALQNLKNRRFKGENLYVLYHDNTQKTRIGLLNGSPVLLEVTGSLPKEFLLVY